MQRGVLSSVSRLGVVLVTGSSAESASLLVAGGVVVVLGRSASSSTCWPAPSLPQRIATALFSPLPLSFGAPARPRQPHSFASQPLQARHSSISLSTSSPSPPPLPPLSISARRRRGERSAAQGLQRLSASSIWWLAAAAIGPDSVAARLEVGVVLVLLLGMLVLLLHVRERFQEEK